MGSRLFVAKSWLLLAMAAIVCVAVGAQTKPETSTDYLRQGNQFSQQQKWKQAESAYRKALSFAPNSAKAHYGLGNALAAQQDVGNAIREYQRALVLAPDLEGIHRALGALFESVGQLPQALKEYQAELKHHPDDTGAMASIARVFSARGNYQEAIQEYGRALERDPKMPASRQPWLERCCTPGRSPRLCKPIRRLSSWLPMTLTSTRAWRML